MNKKHSVKPENTIGANGQSVAVNTRKDTDKRYVVYLDIMGFKNWVARDEHNAILKQLMALSGAIIEIQKQLIFSNVLVTQFSDSIVLFSDDDTLECFESISKTAIKIIKKAIELKIPIRGAIALGMITMDTKRNIFFGQALIDAYLLEENVHYYGIVAHSSVEKKIKEIPRESILKVLYNDIKTPLKAGEIKHYDLSWIFNTENKKIEPNVEEWVNNIRESVSDSPRLYIDNTLKVIHLIRESGTLRFRKPR